MGEEREYKVALAGSPNVGKSTLFNVLTGSKQHVGNWPGKTIERYEGTLTHHGKRLRVIDLPGTYSLSAVSDEEIIAREFIVSERPDVVVVIVNALEFQTSMYLALQVMELTDRVVIAVNKMDAAAKRGIHVRIAELSRRLGVPVVAISALRRQGLHDLVERVLDVAEGNLVPRPHRVSYGPAEYYIREIEEVIRDCPEISRYPARWVALRLAEGDRDLEERLGKACPEVLAEIHRLREKAEKELGGPLDIVMVSKRYEVISSLYDKCIALERIMAPTFTETLDIVMLHPVLGPLTSALLMLALLVAVFSLNTGFPLNVLLAHLGLEAQAEALEKFSLAGLLGQAFDRMADSVHGVLITAGAPEWLADLASEGIVSGVGSILSFYPLILMVYLAFGFLEDSGLMARIAVVMDKLARWMGLSGKALLPIILGFGCNVPAILGTRVLESDEERKLAMLLAPIVPCQARLFVTLAVVTALVGDPFRQALMVASVYAYSLLLFVALSSLFRFTLLRGYKPPDIIIELPPYHKPSLRVLAWHAWDRSEHFIRKASTVILALSLVMWALTRTGTGGAALSLEDSYAYLLGLALTPLGSVAGLGDWRIMFAFEAGFVAKEGMIEALMIVTGASNPIEAVRSVLRGPAEALAFTLAAAVYTPCVPTLAAFYEESRNVKLTALLVLYELALAFLSASIAYHALATALRS